MGRNSKKSTEICYSIAEGNGVKILERHVETANAEYDFYDICIANTVILKDCRLVSGKNGDFIATPSRKDGDKYYPQAYISEAVQKSALDLINDEEAWYSTDIQYLEFEKAEKSEKLRRSASRRRR